MIADELKLYQNPWIQVQRGEWQVGDKGVYRTIPFIVTGTNITKPLTIAVFLPNTVIYGKLPFDDKDTLWLPAALDSLGPNGSSSGRCLWGMVEWNKLKDRFISYNWDFLVMQSRGQTLHNVVATPILELLLVIDEQHPTEA